MLHFSEEAGLRPIHAEVLDGEPVESTHSTVRVRVPSPQGALHSPQDDTCHENDWQGAVLHGVEEGSSGGVEHSAPDGDVHVAWREEKPPPQVALHALHDEYVQ